ncbi:undecaprenyl-diphosphate phosphatase [Candidatus Woesearchaeota archaeon]|nr:undecaprenyl-diphosphate phosphatase [Candidatus Woesearchaeota archaeon]
MTSILQAIIMGIVQGITEWLPISSSGHLVLFQKLFGISPPLVFDIVLHLGSLLVVLLVFRKDLLRLIKGLIQREKTSWNYFFWLIAASVPIALVGFFLNDLIKQAFDSLLVVGFSFLFTALLLLLSKYPQQKTRKLSLPAIIAVGCVQALAILPGVSRSGSTISIGLLQGVKPEEAARFSFLLFIPAILGAMLVELPNINQLPNLTTLLIGTAVTILVGYFSLRLLLKILKQQKFYYFGWYCLVMGVITLWLA